MMSCKHCGIELPTGSNPRQAFCKPSHRQAYLRERHEDWIHAVCLNVDSVMVEVEELSTEITDMELTNAAPAQELDEMTRQITPLRSRLNVERRYLSDLTPYHFQS